MPTNPTPSVNPSFAAKHIAGLLDADPVMARLVREYLPDERLREVLELPPDRDPRITTYYDGMVVLSRKLDAIASELAALADSVEL